MKQLRSLVAMQLRDKVDFSWIKNNNERRRVIIFSLLKFIVITLAVYLILYIGNILKIFLYDESSRIMVLVMTISLLLSLLSCTYGLMKTLFYAEDNLVLITMPVKANVIFISKIIVYFLFELKKSFSFLIPITIACVTLLFSQGFCSIFIYLWMWIPLIFIIVLPVLLGSILSIPFLFIYRLIKKNIVIELISTLIIMVLVIFMTVKLISLIPTNINLIQQWDIVRNAIREFLLFLENNLVFMRELTRIVIGEFSGSMYSISFITILKFVIMICMCIVLFWLSFALSRPLFYRMLCKNFEINKNNNQLKRNHKHNKYFSFILKELIISIRSSEEAMNLLITYTIIPILILLLNRIYSAMDTRQFGNLLVYAFNVLLICLPLFASNAVVATMYSKEGRAGYLKKTLPVYAAYPLCSKLFLISLMALPCVFVSTFIFGFSSNLSIIQIIVCAFAILFMDYGHIIYSASLDIFNPQNEQYATTGVTVDNPNENKSTIIAFICAFCFALVSYQFLSEASNYNNTLLVGFVKLLVIGICFFGANLFLFFKKIRAYYYEK